MGSGCSRKQDDPSENGRHDDIRHDLKRSLRASLTSTSGVNVNVKKKKDSTSVGPEKKATNTTDTKPRPPPIETQPTALSAAVPSTHNEAPSPAKSPQTKVPVSPYINRYPENVQKLLLGTDGDETKSIHPNVVQLYVSTCGSDSVAERDALVERVFPKIRLYCAARGYSFDVVDLSWGVPSDFLDNIPFYLELSRQKLQECLQISTGPAFLAFVNNKLGTVTVPDKIKGEDFVDFISKVDSDAEKTMLQQWYKPSGPSTDVVYVLQSMKSVLYYASKPDPEEVRAQWREIEEKLYDMFYKIMTCEQKAKYLQPVLLREIKSTIFDTCEHVDRSIVVQRHITNSPSDISLKSATEFFDVRHEELDSKAEVALDKLKDRLDKVMSQANLLKFDLAWSENDWDSSEHSVYLKSLCCKVEVLLRHLIDNAIYEKQESNKKTQLSKIQKTLHDELVRHSLKRQSLCKNNVSDTAQLDRIRTYLIDESHMHPLIVHGPAGSGKSTLMAKVASSCSTWLDGAVTVVRFVGWSVHSMYLEEILHLIVQQISCIYGVPIRQAAKGFSKDPTAFQTFLSGLDPWRPLVVLLDGLDECIEEEGPSLAWLSNTLPGAVKIIISMNTEFTGMDKIQSVIKQKSAFMKVMPMKPSEVKTMVSDKAKLNNDVVPETLISLLKKHSEESMLPLYIDTVFAIANAELRLSIDCETNSDHLQDVHSIFTKVLVCVEQKFGKQCVERILALLTASRFGLSDAEMNDLISCDDLLLPMIFSYDNRHIRRSPCLVWTALKTYLKPFIHIDMFQQSILCRWKHKLFQQLAAERYLSSKSQREAAHVTLMDYFNSRWANNKKKPFADPEEGIDILYDRYVLAQPNAYDGCPNTRKFLELPTHSCFSREEDCFEKSVLNFDWLLSSIKAIGTIQTIQNMSLSEQQQIKYSSSIALLQETLQLSSTALDVDTGQLYTQLSVRLKDACNKHAKTHSPLKKLLKKGKCANSLQLMPSTLCLRTAQKDNKANPGEFGVYTGIYHIKSNQHHVVSLCEETGLMKVWDVYRQIAVRTICGLDHPKDVQMLHDSHAVILCNRELNIFNLDEGTFEGKLKGVLNVKMPFYGIHDAKHVVTLSRNRMYVNIINIDSGDMETSFKAGEDRFLNSLLISANGETLVCGDETQKPFPLLVWDLPNRKLVHDLRIPQHEFITSMADIKDNGRYAAFVCKELDVDSPNFVIIYDLQSGQIFKKWKPDQNTVGIAISSPNNSVISILEDGSLQVFDLVSGSCSSEIPGAAPPGNKIYLSEDGKMCVTYDATGSSKTISMWNVHEGMLAATFTPDDAASCCQIALAGDAVIVGLPGYEDLITLHLRRPGDPDEIRETEVYGELSREMEIFDISKTG